MWKLFLLLLGLDQGGGTDPTAIAAPAWIRMEAEMLNWIFRIFFDDEGPGMCPHGGHGG